jgi:hypothetical protein
MVITKEILLYTGIVITYFSIYKRKYLDWPGGEQKDSVPHEVLDGVRVAGVVEEGHARVDGAADRLHAETLNNLELHEWLKKAMLV